MLISNSINHLKVFFFLIFSCSCIFYDMEFGYNCLYETSLDFLFKISFLVVVIMITYVMEGSNLIKIMGKINKEKKALVSYKWLYVITPLLEECEDDIYTPEMGTWESSMTPKTSEFDCRVKTPRLETFFMSLETYWSLDVENGLAWAIWTTVAQVRAKIGSGVKLAIWFPTTQSR